MQGFVNEEFHDIVQQFDTAIENLSGVISPNELFTLPSLNVAWASAAGFRFEHDHPNINELLKLNTELIKASRVNNPGEAFPILKKLFPSKYGYEDSFKINHAIQAFIKGLIEDIKETGTYKEEAKSFIDVFLQQIESPEGTDRSEIFTEENLITILYDIFMAAGDTTAGTMAFALLWLTINPEVQEKCYEELVKVIGKDRLPQLADKMDLPYVRATILEVHRRSVVLPLLPHKVYKDVEFQGYHIPKNTLAIINLYSSQMDPDLWGDPENFRPERFLDSNGNIVNEHKLLTFSIGKRNCVGETVAETALFSFLTGIIQNYRLLPVKPSHTYETKPVFGGTLVPHPYEIKVIRR